MARKAATAAKTRRKRRTRTTKKSSDLDAVVALLEALPRVLVRDEGPYTAQDRANDFRSVFSGSSSADQGQRVLSQIAQICDPSPRRDDADHPGRLAFDLGKRRVMAEIMLCMVARPTVTIEHSSQDQS